MKILREFFSSIRKEALQATRDFFAPLTWPRKGLMLMKGYLKTH